MNTNEPKMRVIYEFGDFQLDAGRRLLYAKAGSTPLAIKPKVLDALLFFVRNAGELLEKDRLLAEVWPGLIVEESGLTQVISTLRRVLKETPGENRYLATVPGRGYTFVAEVVQSPYAAEIRVGQESPDSAPSPVPGRSRRSFFVFGLLALTALLVFVLWSYGGLVRREAARAAPAAASDPASTTAGLPARSVAVLPFENLSADASDAFVAFGIAESVLHRMAAIQGLTLIARTSSFAQSVSAADVRSIGRSLNARYLIEGSVHRSGERLRITSQLIDASTGAHLWSLRFDRSIDDIFAVEDEIARNIALALEVSLDSEKHPYARFGTDAYLEYLQGRAFMASTRIEDAERAIEHFEHAIEIAPEFAASYVALANAHWQLALLQQTSGTGFHFMVRGDRQREQLAAAASEAQPLLDRAFELDDTLAEAYVLRAEFKEHAGDAAGAEADYVEGLARNPNDSAGHERYASFLWEHRDGDAIAEIDEAIRLDPLAPRIHYLKGAMHYAAGRIGEAEPNFLNALALAPDYHPALLRLGLIRWEQSRFAEAIRLGERALAVDPRAEWIRWPLAQFYLEVADIEAARSVLLEAPETVPPYDWLAICLYEGQAHRAAELLRADPSFRYRVDIGIRAYVLRDAARVSGRHTQALEELQDLPSHLSPPDMEPFTLVALAQVYLALGDHGEAESLARSVQDVFSGQRYARAAALTLLADHDAALDLLEEVYADGDRRWWWYAFEQDAGFDTIRGHPRFQALATKAKAHAAAERESLERMRDRGQAPVRRAKEPSDPGVC